MVVLDVGFEMLREIVDAFGQNRHLHFRRPPVARFFGECLDYFGLAVRVYRHRSSFLEQLALPIRPARLKIRLGTISPRSSSARAKSWPETVTWTVPRILGASR